MKYFIILSLFLSIGLVSCEKEESPYKDGGVLPYGVSEEDEDTLRLDGTKWLLTYFQKGFVSEKPYDTIVFTTYGYSLNGKKYDQYTYILSKSSGLSNSLDLRLYGFSPFGDNGIWETTLVNTFISEGEINLSVFENPPRNETTIKASFKRID